MFFYINICDLLYWVTNILCIELLFFTLKLMKSLSLLDKLLKGLGLLTITWALSLSLKKPGSSLQFTNPIFFFKINIQWIWPSTSLIILLFSVLFVHFIILSSSFLLLFAYFQLWSSKLKEKRERGEKKSHSQTWCVFHEALFNLQVDRENCNWTRKDDESEHNLLCNYF